jgi:hypothetical protein
VDPITIYALIAILLLGRGGSGTHFTGMKPAPVGANEMVSGTTYRLIAERRPGMEYTSLRAGTLGERIAFSSPVNGIFTRNLVLEGGVLWAEIKPS